MRKKEVEIEGQKFTIAPLNTEQVEALLEVDVNDKTVLRESRYNVVLQGLNNPIPAVQDVASTERSWDRDRVRKELDWPTFNGLYAAICEFTGLQTVTVDKPQGKPEGEAQAAPVTSARPN